MFCSMKQFVAAGVVAFAIAASSVHGADLGARAPGRNPAPIGPACGYSSPITLANNQAAIGYATNHLDYTEFNPSDPNFANPALATGAPVASEKGWLSGVSGTGSAMFNMGSLCNIYVFGRSSYFAGTTQGGGGAVSHSKIWENDFRLGKGFALGTDTVLTPYLGGGLRNWTTSFCQQQPCPGGFHEDHNHGYLGAGLLVQYAPVSRMVLSASGLIGGTISPEVTGGPVPTSTVIIPFRNGLGASPIYKLEGSLDYAFTQQIHGNAGVEYTYFKYGQSSPFVVDAAQDTAIEPNSRTSTVTVRVGLGFAFGALVAGE
jgi:hypothetical protein